MKILITGSEGLIGTALCKNLISANIKPIRLDKKFPPTHPNYGDILNKIHLDKAVEDCDGIIHLAAVSRVIWGETNPELCWKTNYQGTFNVVESAFQTTKKPWILYASSREVYGSPLVLPASEESGLNPVNIYGESKAAAEALISEAREKGLFTAIVRYSNVYGSPDDHQDRVIPAFCRAAALGMPIRVEGPQNTFDFTHIKDVVEGTMRIILMLSNKDNNLPPFHLTTGQETSLQKAADLANIAGGGQSSINYAVPRTFDVANFYGDSTRTRNILDWMPQISIEEGINELTTFFKYNLNPT